MQLTRGCGGESAAVYNWNCKFSDDDYALLTATAYIITVSIIIAFKKIFADLYPYSKIKNNIDFEKKSNLGAGGKVPEIIIIIIKIALIK